LDLTVELYGGAQSASTKGKRLTLREGPTNRP